MRSVSSLIKRHNKAFKSDSQRLAFSLRSSIAKRRSHLNAALCLITSNQLVVSFLCSLGLLVMCLSASWFRLELFSGHLFFGAGNSESCLSQFSSKREVGAAGSISILTTSFRA
ncbi:hypothetical protein CGH14_03085 [Vibrio parahaemolyticus]|nr:hypothetical protein E4P16_25885 [Vibrio parahaemolyticus]TOP53448.1 hypothetical protein CGH14_03085 [Vibrio parahaemolyticus]